VLDSSGCNSRPETGSLHPVEAIEAAAEETTLSEHSVQMRSWKGDLHPMAKIIPITEFFQHFLAEMKESFWSDLYGTREAWQRFFELQSERQRDRFSGWGRYERRRETRRDYRNGYYERDFVTRFGTIRLRIARTRGKSFLPESLASIHQPACLRQ
jgi:hypothetical protein